MRGLYKLLTNPSFAKNQLVEVAKTGDEVALRMAVDDLITALCIRHERMVKRRRGAVGLRRIFGKCPRPIPPSERIGRKRHVISPATATEIRKTLGITKTEMHNVLRAFKKAGVEV